MAQSDMRTAKVLQFFGIAVNLAILTTVGLAPVAVAVGVRVGVAVGVAVGVLVGVLVGV